MIKRALREVLCLSEDAILMVTELACLEDDYAPVETVIALMLSGKPQQQSKIHTSIEDLAAVDLVQVGIEWGFYTQESDFEPFFTKH